MLAGNVLDEGTTFSPTDLESDSDIESYFTSLYQFLPYPRHNMRFAGH